MKVFRLTSSCLLALSFPTAAFGNPFAPGYPQRNQLFGDRYMQEEIRFPEIPTLEFSDIFTDQNNPVSGNYFGDEFPFSKED